MVMVWPRATVAVARNASTKGTIIRFIVQLQNSGFEVFCADRAREDRETLKNFKRNRQNDHTKTKPALRPQLLSTHPNFHYSSYFLFLVKQTDAKFINSQSLAQIRNHGSGATQTVRSNLPHQAVHPTRSHHPLIIADPANSSRISSSDFLMSQGIAQLRNGTIGVRGQAPHKPAAPGDGAILDGASFRGPSPGHPRLLFAGRASAVPGPDESSDSARVAPQAPPACRPGPFRPAPRPNRRWHGYPGGRAAVRPAAIAFAIRSFASSSCRPLRARRSAKLFSARDVCFVLLQQFAIEPLGLRVLFLPFPQLRQSQTGAERRGRASGARR